MSLKVRKTRQVKPEHQQSSENDQSNKKRVFSRVLGSFQSRSSSSLQENTYQSGHDLARKASLQSEVSGRPSSDSWDTSFAFLSRKNGSSTGPATPRSTSGVNRETQQKWLSPQQSPVASPPNQTPKRGVHGRGLSISSLKSVYSPCKQLPKRIRTISSASSRSCVGVQSVPSITSVRISTYAEVGWMKIDDESSFWIAVDAAAYDSRESHSLTSISPDLSSGHIHDVAVGFIPSPCCTIQKILGQETSKSVLGTGETYTVMALVTVASCSTITLDDHDDSQGCNSRVLNTAFDDLEATLGVSVTPVVTVKCRYRHSLLPPEHQVSVEETSFIRRATRTPGQLMFPTTDSKEEAQTQRHQVHRRLIEQIALHYEPEDALMELNEAFDPIRRRCACSEYLETVYREVKRRIEEGHAESLFRLGHLSDSLPDVPDNPSHGRFSFENRPPQIRSFSDHAVTMQKGVCSTPRPNSLKRKENEQRDYVFGSSPDEARSIWRHIRKASRPKGAGLRTVTEAHEEPFSDHMKEIQQLALKNKRSVGEDTLRSLALGPTEQRLNRRDAPWL